MSLRLWLAAPTSIHFGLSQQAKALVEVQSTQYKQDSDSHPYDAVLIYAIISHNHRLYQTSHEPVATQTQIEAPHSLHPTPIHNPPCTPINRLSRRLSEALEHDLQAITLKFLHQKSNENSRVTAAKVILGLLECFETWGTLVVDLRMEGHWFFETRVAVSRSTVSDCICLVD